MNKPLPPPHPSLPNPPVAGFQTQFLQPSTSYGGAHPAYYNCSSHYAQAYYPPMAFQPVAAPGSNFSSVPTNKGKGTPVHMMSSWYHPGNIRCSYPGCSFHGSQKSVEVHKMDMHLIYPPDWEKRKKKSDWDADPSLKGKLIPIQGTSVVLDTPELVDAWITERKRLYPTSTRVAEKKRKLAEAVERGQLDLNPSRALKRRKIDPQTVRPDGQRSQMHVSRGQARNRRKQRQGQESAPELNVAPNPCSAEKGDRESDDDDASPEELSSKLPYQTESLHVNETVSTIPSTRPRPQEQQRRLKEPQPRGPPKNPFASRPALLRNLLLPEIRMTVSNLSQAIRFLVDNDFLRNVELKPGQAAEQQKIHVLNGEEPSIT